MQTRATLCSSSRDDDDGAVEHQSKKQQRGSSSASSLVSVGRTLVEVARANPDRIAVVSPNGDNITYAALLSHAETLAGTLRRAAAAAAVAEAKSEEGTAGLESSELLEDDGSKNVTTNHDVLRGARVAISATPGPEYVSAMHATWMCGAIAVPIARTHTRDEVEYVLRDAGVKVMAMIAEEEHRRDYLLSLSSSSSSSSSTGVRAVETPPLLEIDGEEGRAAFHDEDDDDDEEAGGGRAATEGGGGYAAAAAGSDEGALIIYTSGTTGRPKGVLHTHGTLAAQCSALVSAWWGHSSISLVHSFVHLIGVHSFVHLIGAFIRLSHWRIHWSIGVSALE